MMVMFFAPSLLFLLLLLRYCRSPQSILCICSTSTSTLLLKKFHFSVIFQFVCLFVCLLSENFDVLSLTHSLSLSGCLVLRLLHSISENRLNWASIQRVNWFVSLWYFGTFCVNFSFSLSLGLFIGSPKLNSKLHEYIFEFIWTTCTMYTSEIKMRDTQKCCYAHIYGQKNLYILYIYIHLRKIFAYSSVVKLVMILSVAHLFFHIFHPWDRMIWGPFAVIDWKKQERRQREPANHKPNILFLWFFEPKIYAIASFF